MIEPVPTPPPVPTSSLTQWQQVFIMLAGMILTAAGTALTTYIQSQQTHEVLKEHGDNQKQLLKGQEESHDELKQIKKSTDAPTVIVVPSEALPDGAKKMPSEFKGNKQ